MTLFREAGLGTPRDSEMYEGPTDMCEDRDPCLFWEAVQTEHETLCLLTTCLQFLPAGGTARSRLRRLAACGLGEERGNAVLLGCGKTCGSPDYLWTKF